MSRDRQNRLTRWACWALLVSVFPAAASAQAGPTEAAESSEEASAEPSAEDTARARALFQQGMQAIDAGDFETGADRLGRSLEVRNSVVVRANYALALIELGRLVEASEHLRIVQRTTEPGSDAHQLAVVQLGHIQPRFGSLQIDLSGGSDGIEVRVDDRRVPAASLGVPQPADPGARVVTLHRGDQQLVSREVNVEQGQLATLALAVPPPTAAELARAEAANTRILERERIVVRDRGGGVEEEPWFWLLVSGLAAGAVAAVITAIVLTQQETVELEEGSSGNTFLTLVELP